MIDQYHMHKKEGAIEDRDEMLQLLRAGKYVIIAMCAGNNPYIVTLSYGYDEKKHTLYFHSAMKGLKLDILNENSTVCATVIDDRGYQMDKCSHVYRSLLLYGKMSMCHTLEEQKHGMNILLEHLEDNPDTVRQRSLKSDDVYKRTAILKLEIEEMTGKQGA